MAFSSRGLAGRSWIFISIGRLSSKLPAFRGRTRIFLILYALLGLKNHRILVDAKMKSPVSFATKLDIQSWLQRVAFLTGEYESDTVNFLNKLRKSHASDGYLLDVGANIGMISIPFALLTRKETDERPVVFAVEAVPDNADSLQTNINANSLQENVQIVRAALGECEKEIKIQVEGDLAAGEGTGTANIMPDDSTYQCVTQTLQLKTLNSFFDSGVIPPNCSVIKIDTDGYDLKVLEGAKKLLDSSRPIVFGEFSAHCMAWHGQSVRDINAFAASIDYEVLFRDSNSLKFRVDEPAGGFVQDILLVPKECLREVEWCMA